jgi:hypothetical protein
MHFRKEGQHHKHEKIILTAPHPSTCDFMYNKQRPPLYYGGQKQKYYLTPSTADLPSKEGSADNDSNGTQSAHKGKRREGGGVV